MNARAILAKLRHGETPTPEELCWMAQGLATGEISDAQAGAFAMAVCLNGLGAEGRVALTLAMRDSGHVMRWELDDPVVDKHSTGGVGDCVSLVLAPALAACGVYVPMISGRGLGHTGGTLDKLEAIPDVNIHLDETQLKQVVAQVGCAVVGATADIAPADKRLYAVRDISSTVDSLDLITASILSKKLAAGLDTLVLDVKVGSGAFMKDINAAQDLAQALVHTANDAGCPTSAMLSDMNQPLVPSIGNALEVAEVMRALTNPGDVAEMVKVCGYLGGELLHRAGKAPDVTSGQKRVEDAVASGAAADRFGEMIAALGGPTDFVEHWQRYLPEAPVIREVLAPCAGRIAQMDAEALGLAVVALGGGRARENDQVNPAVGLSEVRPLGADVSKGEPLAVIHAAREADADRAMAAILSAITITEAPVDVPPLLLDWVR